MFNWNNVRPRCEKELQSVKAEIQRFALKGATECEATKVALPQTTQSNFIGSRVRNLQINLYVGNLSVDTPVAKIRRIFEEFGTVSDCFFPTDCDSGRVCGYAFVTMPAAEVEIACNNVNGQKVDGRTLEVTEASKMPVLERATDQKAAAEKETERSKHEACLLQELKSCQEALESSKTAKAAELKTVIEKKQEFESKYDSCLKELEVMKERAKKQVEQRDG
jgi:RNA recognition motif-containing protein